MYLYVLLEGSQLVFSSTDFRWFSLAGYPAHMPSVREFQYFFPYSSSLRLISFVSVNDSLMELLIMLDALKRASGMLSLASLFLDSSTPHAVALDSFSSQRSSVCS